MGKPGSRRMETAGRAGTTPTRPSLDGARKPSATPGLEEPAGRLPGVGCRAGPDPGSELPLRHSGDRARADPQGWWPPVCLEDLQLRCSGALVLQVYTEKTGSARAAG